jgi:hypothetical protein
MRAYGIKSLICIAAVIVLATAMSARADELAVKPKHFGGIQNDRVISPKLVAGLIAWITSKTGWTVSDAPPVRFVSEAQLREMYFGGSVGSDNIQVHAIYSDEDHTVYLPDKWNPESLFDRSALLHELVHHLQVSNGVKANCPAEYGKQAFHLQIDWLHEQGIEDPYEFLKIDERYIFYSSRCW